MSKPQVLTDTPRMRVERNDQLRGHEKSANWKGSPGEGRSLHPQPEIQTISASHPAKEHTPTFTAAPAARFSQQVVEGVATIAYPLPTSRLSPLTPVRDKSRKRAPKIFGFRIEIAHEMRPDAAPFFGTAMNKPEQLNQIAPNVKAVNKIAKFTIQFAPKTGIPQAGNDRCWPQTVAPKKLQHGSNRLSNLLHLPIGQYGGQKRDDLLVLRTFIPMYEFERIGTQIRHVVIPIVEWIQEGSQMPHSDALIFHHD